MHEPNNKIHNLCRLLLPLVLAFAAGSALTGLFLHRQRLAAITELNRRYAAEHRSARDAIANLETELGRERAINRELRDHNSRAREIVEGLTETSGRTIRNLQEAGESRFTAFARSLRKAQTPFWCRVLTQSRILF